MNSKLYDLQAVLDELSISKATLYHRINKIKSKIDPHTSIRNGKKYFTQEGIEILRSSVLVESVSDNSDTVLHDIIQVLKDQLAQKDAQIETLSRLVENSQILLKQEQETRLLAEPKKSSFFSKFFN